MPDWVGSLVGKVFSEYGLIGVLFLASLGVIFLLVRHFVRYTDKSVVSIDTLTKAFVENSKEGSKALNEISNLNVVQTEVLRGIEKGLDRVNNSLLDVSKSVRGSDSTRDSQHIETIKTILGQSS